MARPIRRAARRHLPHSPQPRTAESGAGNWHRRCSQVSAPARSSLFWGILQLIEKPLTHFGLHRDRRCRAAAADISRTSLRPRLGAFRVFPAFSTRSPALIPGFDATVIGGDFGRRRLAHARERPSSRRAGGQPAGRVAAGEVPPDFARRPVERPRCHSLNTQCSR